MKQSSIFVILTVLMLLLSLTACAPSTGKDLSGAEKDQAMVYIDPIANNLLTGFNKSDYAVFSHDFDDQMLSGLDQQKFEATKKQINDKIGSYKSRKLDKVIDYGAFITAVYNGTFSQGSKIQILLSVSKHEPHKVTGLYFR